MTHQMLPASPLVLGAMSFGTRIDEDTSFALLDRFVERGGVWIDTADCYSFWDSPTGHGGASEAVLGRWFAARPEVREQVRLSTKLGAEPLWPGSWPDRRAGLSTRAIRDAVAGSLDRLGIDHIDLLWLHQEDRSVPIEETVEALAELTSENTVRRVGASNHPAWRVERARAHAKKIGSLPIDAFQLNSTYLRARPGTQLPGVVHRFGALHDEQRDYATEHGIEVWAYTPLLSGAYDNPDKTIAEVYDHPGNTQRLAVLDEIAGERGVQRGQIVLAWLLAHGIRPILGGSKLHQLETAMDAAALTLAPEEVAAMDAPA
ncbi:aldo/keto reductase [Microbacterium profundi]|uniref:aldo/keto reductase n=1 Tax=Microbacterium profundi TaxID=450380 RepID=UPI000A8FF3B9|nr:aldo/keto reductase [Microbacterium profundi]